MEKLKKLNIGCGKDYKDPKLGWVNLDFNSDYKTDIRHNLNKFPYPFKDKEIDHIYCSHILEHVSDLFKTMKELELQIELKKILLELLLRKIFFQSEKLNMRLIIKNKKTEIMKEGFFFIPF